MKQGFVNILTPIIKHNTQAQTLTAQMQNYKWTKEIKYVHPKQIKIFTKLFYASKICILLQDAQVCTVKINITIW